VGQILPFDFLELVLLCLLVFLVLGDVLGGSVAVANGFELAVDVEGVAVFVSFLVFVQLVEVACEGVGFGVGHHEVCTGVPRGLLLDEGGHVLGILVGVVQRRQN